MGLRHGSVLLTAGMLWGCATVSGTPPLDPVPLFQVDTDDTGFLQTVHREQETLLNTCTRHRSCDQVHFTRAMIGLFHDKEVAAASFRQAIDVAPNGPFADSSARWIEFLANRTYEPPPEDPSNRALLEVMKGLVRAWLGQQRSVSMTSRAMETVTAPDPVVHTLKRQIRDRDRRIAELTDQLSALKQIDSEAHRTNKLRLPRRPSK